MGKIAIGFGLAFVLLGVGFYVGTGSTHKTALIPAGIGLVLALLGVAASYGGEKVRMHTMHLAALLGVLGFLAMFRAYLTGFAWLAGTTPERPAAIVEQILFGIGSLAFVGLCVQSFIEARRARAQREATPTGGSQPQT